MARSGPAEDSTSREGEAVNTSSSVVRTGVLTSAQSLSRSYDKPMLSGTDLHPVQSSGTSRSPFAQSQYQDPTGEQSSVMHQGIVWGYQVQGRAGDSMTTAKAPGCLDSRARGPDHLLQQLQVLSVSSPSPAAFPQAASQAPHSQKEEEAGSGPSAGSGASYQAGLLASEEEALLKRLLLLQLEKQRLAEQAGNVEGLGSQQHHFASDYLRLQSQQQVSDSQTLQRGSQQQAQGTLREEGSELGLVQSAGQRKEEQGRTMKETKGRQQHAEGTPQGQNQLLGGGGSRPGVPEGNRRRMARGPRSEGPADLEPMFTEDHRVLKVERSDDGREAYVWVTLLAAGFVIGSSGAAARQIGHVTGAGLQSWTETASGVEGVEGEEIRKFRIQGKKEKVERVIFIIHSAVDKYKELCERKRDGQFVLREHRIDGVDFQYQPPPRKALQNKQGVTNSSPGNHASTKRAQSPRKYGQQQHLAGSRDKVLKSPRPSGSSDASSLDGKDQKRSHRHEKKKQNYQQQQLSQQHHQQHVGDSRGEVFQKLGDLDDRESSGGESDMVSPVLLQQNTAGLQEQQEKHLSQQTFQQQQVLQQRGRESLYSQQIQQQEQQQLRRHAEEQVLQQHLLLHHQRQHQQQQHDQQLGLVLEALAGTLTDQGLSNAPSLTSGGGSSVTLPTGIGESSGLKLQGVWGASVQSLSASAPLSSNFSASQHIQALHQQQQQQLLRQQVHWPWHSAAQRMPGMEANGDRWFDLEQSSISSTVLSGGGSSSRGGGSSGNSSPGGSAQGLNGLVGGTRGTWWQQGSGYGNGGQAADGHQTPLFSEVQFPSLPSKAAASSPGMMHQQQSFAGVLSRGGQLQGYRAAVGAQRDGSGLSCMAEQQEQQIGRREHFSQAWAFEETDGSGGGGHLPHALLQDNQQQTTERRQGAGDGNPSREGKGDAGSSGTVGWSHIGTSTLSAGAQAFSAAHSQAPGPFTLSALFLPINQTAGKASAEGNLAGMRHIQQQQVQIPSARGPRLSSPNGLSTNPVLSGRPEGLAAAIGLEGSQLCVVCSQRPVLFSYFPCAHQVICHVCCKSVMLCPVCGMARSITRSGSSTSVAGLSTSSGVFKAPSNGGQGPMSKPSALVVCDPALLPAQLNVHLQRRSASLEGMVPHGNGAVWVPSAGSSAGFLAAPSELGK